ncbi:23S rRNA (adenine(1618)-N(6))-methyltransferase RlmF [Pseudoalteromonas fenneropenaei]|uniref:Ribosomal RNA large subunit methyltransferase F n=1 Tax=Pseudoalteromonas fenneropenaei TaxID=1737459 RepID=A0ABV7CQ04_9GAMM
MHPRNLHQSGYQFASLIKAIPELEAHLVTTPAGTVSIDFANAQSVLLLNQAILKQDYGIAYWTLPPQYLCPPVPGRADYLHHLADLLEADPRIDHNAKVKGLDIGTGASLIYPILGHQIYGWQFVGSDINPGALALAKQWQSFNKLPVKLRTQENAKAIFHGVIQHNEQFTFTLCNPPFHMSAADALQGTQRKWRNLGKQPTQQLNFGGHAPELWCEGGERAFVTQMLTESADFATQVQWFTCLVSKAENLTALEKVASQLAVKEWRIVNMSQGQKRSRFIAWHF